MQARPKKHSAGSISHEHLKLFYVYFHDTRFVPIHVSEIIREMQKHGIEVYIFTCIKDKALIKDLSARKVSIYNLWTIETRYISELVFMFLLAPYLSLKTAIISPDIFYTRHSATSLVVSLVSKFFNKPHAIEINDIVLDKLKFMRVSRAKTIWIQLYHYINYRLADLLFPVTEQIAFWIREKYSVSPEKVTVIPNGVNPRRFSPKQPSKARKRYQIPLESKVVLTLGSLFPWVGIETLIDAAPIVLDTYPETLFVIGSGEEPYLSKIKEAVSQADLTDVFVFFGFIPWDDASWFISAADICVAPFNFKSTRSGISSLRVFSYLACAKPVIGSDIPGLGDLLEKQGMGRSFPMGDHNSFAILLIDLLSNRAILKEMGEKGRKFVIDNHSWEEIVSALQARLQICMARKKW